MKHRTISWDDQTHRTAVKLAAQMGYYPEKANGGISRMLADLVLAEARRSGMPLPAYICDDDTSGKRPSPSGGRVREGTTAGRAKTKMGK